MATNCSLKQRQEALDLEKARVAELKANGADVDSMEETLNYYQDNIDKPVRLKNKQQQHNKAFKTISSNVINKMNKENPRNIKGVKLTIKSGYTDPNGKAAYKVTYPNNPKEYTIGAHAIVMDNMDAQHSDRDTLGSDASGSRIRDGEIVLAGTQINDVRAVEELVEALDEADNVGTSKEHKEHLLKIVRHLVGGLKQPVHEMNVYLSDKYEKNNGFIEFGPKQGIYLKKGIRSRVNGTDMSLIETFVHEMVHGTSHYGLNANSVKLSREIRLLSALRKKAMKVLTPEDLMGDVVLNPEVEYKEAEDKLDYMAGENGLEEFLAMALSNEKLFKKLKGIKISEKKKVTTLWDSLDNAFRGLVDAALRLIGKRERTMQGDQLVMKLVSDIGKLNHSAKNIKSTTLRAKASEKIDSFETKWTNWFDNLEKKNQDLIINKLGNREKLGPVDMIRALHMILASEKGSALMQDLLAKVGLNEEGTVQTILRHMKHADKYGNQIQKLILAAQQVDAHRESRAGNVAAAMNTAFTAKMSKARKKAMYIATMIADNTTLIEDYSKNDLMELYKDEEAVDGAIERIEKYISKDLSEEDSRYMLHQARGLANLMMTGESDIVQRKNAKAIVTHVLLNDPSKATEEIVGDVDRLVSLYTLKSLDKTVKDNMAELIKNDYKGVKSVALTQRGFRDMLHSRMPADESLNLMKNYHRETFDSQIDTKIAPTDHKTKNKMYLDGYTLVEDIDNLGLGYGANMQGIGLYVSDELVKRPMNRSSIKYLGDRDSGNSLYQDAIHRGMDTSVYDVVQKQIDNGKKKAEKYEEEIRKGNTPNIDTRVVPVVNASNEVVDYRTEVPTERKLKHLGLEMDSAVAVGRSQAHEIDLEESAQLNEVVWDSLIGDMIENTHTTGTYGKNMRRYVDISKLSDINEVKDAASILPENIRKMMNLVKKVNTQLDNMNSDLDRSVDMGKVEDSVPKPLRKYIRFNEGLDKFELSDIMIEEIAGTERFDSMKPTQRDNLRKIFRKNVFKVRRDMLLDIFGVRDASLSNLIPSHKTTRLLKKAIRKIEDGWKEIVKIFKADVIIRTLPVIMGNIVSNAMYSIQYGLAPWEVLARQAEGVHLLKQHLQELDRLAVIESELMVKPGNKALLRERNEIKDNQRNSPIRPLIESGLYQHIVEDVNMTDLTNSSRIAKYIDEKTDGAPELLKVAGNALFISNKTSVFQMITTMTAYSDFVARYAQYTLGMEKEKTKYFNQTGKALTKAQSDDLAEKMIIQVRDAYVNYSKPDSKLLQYANDMGFVAFTKYAIRVQLAIQDLVKGKPLRFMLALIGQEFMEGVTGWNPDDIAHSSFLNKDISHLLYSPGVSKIIGSVVEPHSIRYLEELFAA